MERGKDEATIVAVKCNLCNRVHVKSLREADAAGTSNLAVFDYGCPMVAVWRRIGSSRTRYVVDVIFETSRGSGMLRPRESNTYTAEYTEGLMRICRKCYTAARR
jgi:hypothetical protein